MARIPESWIALPDYVTVRQQIFLAREIEVTVEFPTSYKFVGYSLLNQRFTERVDPDIAECVSWVCQDGNGIELDSQLLSLCDYENWGRLKTRFFTLKSPAYLKTIKFIITLNSDPRASVYFEDNFLTLYSDEGRLCFSYEHE